jgi:hypothetical protein
MLGEPGWKHLGLKRPRTETPLLDILESDV